MDEIGMSVFHPLLPLATQRGDWAGLPVCACRSTLRIRRPVALGPSFNCGRIGALYV